MSDAPSVRIGTHFSFGYYVSPIDFWRGWHLPGAIFKDAPDSYGFRPLNPDDLDDRIDGWEGHWAEAQEWGCRLGWEGDVRDGPMVILLPDSYGSNLVVLGWKQENNGDCIVVSPHEMPWLNSNASNKMRARR